MNNMYKAYMAVLQECFWRTHCVKLLGETPITKAVSTTVAQRGKSIVRGLFLQESSHKATPI